MGGMLALTTDTLARDACRLMTSPTSRNRTPGFTAQATAQAELATAITSASPAAHGRSTRRIWWERTKASWLHARQSYKHLSASEALEEETRKQSSPMAIALSRHSIVERTRCCDCSSTFPTKYVSFKSPAPHAAHQRPATRQQIKGRRCHPLKRLLLTTDMGLMLLPPHFKPEGRRILPTE